MKRPGECELCPTHGLGYCYPTETCLRADMNAPTERGLYEELHIQDKAERPAQSRKLS